MIDGVLFDKLVRYNGRLWTLHRYQAIGHDSQILVNVAAIFSCISGGFDLVTDDIDRKKLVACYGETTSPLEGFRFVSYPLIFRSTASANCFSYTPRLHNLTPSFSLSTSLVD
jgi:hypothetical protein